MWQAIRGSCELWPASALPQSNPPPPHLAQPWPLPSSQLQEKNFQPSPIPIIPSHGHFLHLNCCSERWGWTVSKLVNLFFMDWIQEYFSQPTLPGPGHFPKYELLLRRVWHLIAKLLGIKTFLLFWESQSLSKKWSQYLSISLKTFGLKKTSQSRSQSFWS